MKKIFLTVLTAALISGGAFAQDNSETAGDSTMIRKDAEQAENQAEDSLERTTDQMQQETKEAGDAVEEGANKTGDAIEQGAEKTGDAIEEGADKTGDAIEKGAEKTGDAIQEGANKTEQAVEESADKTEDAMSNDNDTKTSGEASGTSSDEGTAVAEQVSYGPVVEVVSGKEGPNHEVVYKVNDEMFYVDRQQKQLVKAEESNLKDAKNEAIIHSVTAESK
jgi:dGTP triphosphohydrolase